MKQALYAHKNNLPNFRKTEFCRLIQAMHLVKVHFQKQSEPYPLEKLSDESGVSIKHIKGYVKELQRAEVCSAKIPITILITKGVRGDAKNKYEEYQKTEQKIIDEIVEQLNDRQEIQISCRGLATRLDPERKLKLSSRQILEILEGWKFLKWIDFRKIRSDVVKITKFEVLDHIDRHKILIDATLNEIFQTLGSPRGARLPAKIDLINLQLEINLAAKPQVWELEEIEKALTWKHKLELIQLADGSNLFHQSMKISVIKGTREEKVIKEFPKQVKPHYDDQTRRTHVMLDYGNQHAQPDFNPQEYIANYFSLSESEFSTHYPNIAGEAAKRQVTQEDYDRIIQPLNPIQQEIVLCDSSAISVIAGPGSGKTLTIVHRLAYLVKVKRVDPARIIALAYNRNAVRELRIRLKDLIGEMASRLRVYTFHGLSLSILGRTVEPTNNEANNQKNSKDSEDKFSKLIKDACDFLEKGEDEIEDQQSRIIKLLGNSEYIFVDEYQDVAEHEYHMVKLIAGLQISDDKSRSVQTNICVIGDDDQNIYEFRGTKTDYIRSYQSDYHAKQFLLTENYRSTEPIIATSNLLIQKNSDRLKRKGDEQVRIDNEREGQGGLDVQSLRFADDDHQAEYIKRQVQKWISQETKPGKIAILARNWHNLDKVRALLDQMAGIPTYSLKGEDVKLVKNQVTQMLITDLERVSNLILDKEESVRSWFIDFLKKNNRNLSEPTVKALVKIAEDIDQERGYKSELATPIAFGEVITSIYEFSESPNNKPFDSDAVLVTSCHGAKGLEFKYVILISDGFEYRRDKVEQERRLYYVAMTRAEEKLILTHSENSQFIEEAGAKPFAAESMNITPLSFVFYADLTPKDIHLGFQGTKDRQEIIKKLKEGDEINLRVTSSGDNWTIRSSNQVIGLLSKNAVDNLRKRAIMPGNFTFQPGEVKVRNVYRHLKTDEVNGDILEDWYLVIPQIRVCR